MRFPGTYYRLVNKLSADLKYSRQFCPLEICRLSFTNLLFSVHYHSRMYNFEIHYLRLCGLLHFKVQPTITPTLKNILTTVRTDL